MADGHANKCSSNSDLIPLPNHSQVNNLTHSHPVEEVAILSGVVLNTYIFQTIHCTETAIASLERGGLPLSNDTNFNFIPSLVNDLLA